MATDEELLARYLPKLCYDSLEAFFADHPLQMLVNPGNTLRRGPAHGRDGAVLVTAPDIELGWPQYRGGEVGAASDRLGIKGRDYHTQYVAPPQGSPRPEEQARRARRPRSRQLTAVAPVLALVPLQR